MAMRRQGAPSMDSWCRTATRLDSCAQSSTKVMWRIAAVRGEFRRRSARFHLHAIARTGSTMNKYVARAVGTACLFGLATSQGSLANAATMTFESPVVGFFNSFTEAGFVVQPVGGNGQAMQGNTLGCGPTCADNGGRWILTLSVVGYADTISVTASDGHAFTLRSFDGAEGPHNDQAPFAWASGIRVTGRRADSSTTAQDFPLDQINDGQGGVTDFQRFKPTFANAFVEISFTGIVGNGRDFIIDNIELDGQQTPEPGTLALITLGLAGVGWSRRGESARRLHLTTSEPQV